MCLSVRIFFIEDGSNENHEVQNKEVKSNKIILPDFIKIINPL